MRLTLDHKSHIPLHSQAEELLRKIIEKPEYRTGKLLPKEMDLSRQLAISRTTLRLAINKLVYEGLLVRKKGVGTRVAERAVKSKSQNWVSFSQEMKERGIIIKNFELRVSWVQANEEIARFFDIRPKQLILKLEKLKGRPDRPFAFFISWFHPKIGLTGKEDFNRPIYEILEMDYRVIPQLSREEISAREADKYISRKLELPLKGSILFRKRFVYDKAQNPIEFNLAYYRADSFVYTVESKRF